ncbi:WS/DGAT/MGAT family acyltransferase [Nocardia transvalensis]|uniref:Diacylglycerol O-acyltransferase n=1 Tax=Nocardia transvalensis TaxID=37333 RepID=A0A7W9UI91_9NOCA|nr:wax ester/triacylglycerol synthase family O-acyltransferase [Nocardia transvalensis]MBB5914164.1 WS/DGAT/MGAT family acyltransferase [Nocardia transvalensis]
MRTTAAGDSVTARSRLTAEQLMPRDAVFVYDEFERHPSNIVAAYVFDATDTASPDYESAVGWMRDRLGFSPLFRRRLARVPGDIDMPYWVPDAAFDIREHVTAYGPEYSEWADVRRRISEITGTRMDLSRPPWELHLFGKVTDFPGRPAVTIVVLKFHHSVGDGVATRQLELTLFGGNEVLPADPAGDIGSWSAPAAAVRGLGLLPFRCVRFVRGLARTRAAAAEVAASAVREPVAHRPATRFNRGVGPDLAFDLVTFPLHDILEVKSVFAERVTVNDLLLAVVSGALADYLAERGETPPESLAAMVPISMRGIAPWNSANRLCQMSVDLHTGIADPLERLRAIRSSARDEKLRYRDAAVIRRESRVETSPAWLLRLAGWARARRVFDGVATVPLTNTTISNVPPVSERLEFLGMPVAGVFGVLPVMDGDGLRHLITSQGADLVISVSADPAMLPDPERYRELLFRSFRQLRAAIGA